MPRFRYTAFDVRNQPFAGELDVPDLAAARAVLMHQGLRVTELSVVSESLGVLSSSESAAITQQIAAATSGELPLIGSLRAFQEEVISSRLRGRLERVCRALECGEPLERVLADSSLRLPASITAILGSGLPHEAMTHLLSRAVRAAVGSADLKARTAMLLTYPIVMLCAMVTFWLFLLLWVTPQFESIFKDFGMQVSPLAIQLFEMSRLLQSGNWIFVVLFLTPVVLLGVFGFRFGLNAATRRRVWCGVPILGSMYRLTALSEFAHLLALMLESQVPLPQALIWSSMGVDDADLRACCEDLAQRIRNGTDPVTASREAPGIPAHLEQMLRWATHGEKGADPLRTIGRLLEIRARSLSFAAVPLLEPLMLIGMVLSIVAYVLTVFPPLFKLLNDLA